MASPIRFTYFHDPLTPRVVTVASRYTDERGVLELSYCSNLVHVLDRDQFILRDGRYKWSSIALDPFNKNRAKKILRGRIDKNPYTVFVGEEVPRIQAIVSFFENVTKNPSDPGYIPSAVVSTVLRARREKKGERVADLAGQ